MPWAHFSAWNFWILCPPVSNGKRSPAGNKSENSAKTAGSMSWSSWEKNNAFGFGRVEASSFNCGKSRYPTLLTARINSSGETLKNPKALYGGPMTATEIERPRAEDSESLVKNCWIHQGRIPRCGRCVTGHSRATPTQLSSRCASLIATGPPCEWPTATYFREGPRSCVAASFAKRAVASTVGAVSPNGVAPWPGLSSRRKRTRASSAYGARYRKSLLDPGMPWSASTAMPPSSPSQWSR
mmetsp:Transcript_11000/g.36761  ORF Transcript_11000/g.36761 Transcript_11000/m.36761 type:complete len:241 (-) Transcript_11000:234-956(-)